MIDQNLPYRFLRGQPLKRQNMERESLKDTKFDWSVIFSSRSKCGTFENE